MSPQVGMALAALTALGVVAFTVIVILAFVQGRRITAVLLVVVTGGWLAVYALAVVLTPALTRRVVLAPGQELHFCAGVDCHLHVTVVEPQETPNGVTVRFRSDAVRAPEWPSALRFTLIDEAGVAYAPLDAVDPAPLGARSAREETLHFRVPKGVHAGQLTVTWDSWMDFLVPGQGNPMAQRRKTFAVHIGPPGSS